MRGLPWWAVGLLAAVLAYLALALGLAMTNGATDPHCGLPGGEIMLGLATAVFHPWFGFFVSIKLTRPAQANAGCVLGIGVAFLGGAASLVQLGPPVFATLRCQDEPPRTLGGVVVTGVAVALYAWAGSSARKPSISSATRSGRSSGRK